MALLGKFSLKKTTLIKQQSGEVLLKPKINLKHMEVTVGQVKVEKAA